MQKENKMGVMPIRKLVITMSVPMMISMLVQALYNIVDSIFVAQVCEDALTAVSLAFPAQNLMIGVATGTGVGINALLSRNLGARDFERVNKVANNGVFLVFFSSLIFLIFPGRIISHSRLYNIYRVKSINYYVQHFLPIHYIFLKARSVSNSFCSFLKKF